MTTWVNGSLVSRFLNYVYPWTSTYSILGGFNPGVQLQGTPITAEIVQGSDVDINMAWRDAQGCFASASWSKSLGWDLPNQNGERAPLDGQDRGN